MQAGGFSREVVNDKGKDQASSVLLWLVCWEGLQAAAQEDVVGADVVVAQAGEAVGGHLLNQSLAAQAQVKP
jgi:hypothetical protein